MIEFQKIVKKFGTGTPDEMTLFDGLDLSVQTGQFVSVVGSNGSGKTTILNLLCGTLPADGGRILLNGQDITHLSEFARARKIGRVFQSPEMGSAGKLTILENMALADNKNRPYSLLPALRARRVSTYRDMLAQCDMGLENRLQTPVGTLSGGQKQALALVIANMADIKILILDEHTAALDPKSSERVMALTDAFVRGRGITTLMVTHNLRYAVEHGDRLLMFDKGKIVLDRADAEKRATSVDDILHIFNEISIECGN